MIIPVHNPEKKFIGIFYILPSIGAMRFPRYNCFHLNEDSDDSWPAAAMEMDCGEST